MWIIFDLDDTLIDTSGSITPIALKEALFSMKKQGLDLPFSLEEGYQELSHFNQKERSSELAVTSFARLHGASSNCLEAGLKALSNKKCLEQITLLPDALSVLSRLVERHQLFLVSCGERKFQMTKMLLAGIDWNFFQDGAFSPLTEKKFFYEIFAKKYRWVAEETWVCGDRISKDLVPAKELGYHTVHMRWGRGLGETGLKREVDYTITHLRELEKLLV